MTKYLVATFHCLFVCFSWCYSTVPFLPFDFSIFACRPVLVPLGSPLFERGKPFWIRRFMWVNAMSQVPQKCSEICLHFSPANGFGCYRVIHKTKILLFYLTEKLLPANMVCLFLRTKLDQGYSHCHLPLLSCQGGV